jgi:hypothetical protein
MGLIRTGARPNPLADVFGGIEKGLSEGRKRKQAQAVIDTATAERAAVESRFRSKEKRLAHQFGLSEERKGKYARTMGGLDSLSTKDLLGIYADPDGDLTVKALAADVLRDDRGIPLDSVGADDDATAGNAGMGRTGPGLPEVELAKAAVDANPGKQDEKKGRSFLGLFGPGAGYGAWPESAGGRKRIPADQIGGPAPTPEDRALAATRAAALKKNPNLTEKQILEIHGLLQKPPPVDNPW